MALPIPPVKSVSCLGIDDFSLHRGRTFGTLLVDLDRHRMIDLLSDRTSATAAAWMQTHPEIDLVSRDRGGEYAAAARLGAPQAVQCADRFHLYKNVLEAVERTLAQCRSEIRQAAQRAAQPEESATSPPLVEPTAGVTRENWKPAPDRCTERERLARRAERQDRYEQVVALRAQGLGNTEIARRVGVTARTLQNWQKKGVPEAGRRHKRRSIFDAYAPYVLSRWEQGCTNGSQLYREIKAQGYTGQERQVHRFLVPLRRKERIIQTGTVPQAPLQDFSANETVWLFARAPADLNEQERETLSAICQASGTAQQTYQLVQEFRRLLHQRQGDQLEDWLASVRASGIGELQSFVLGVERDKAAVVAGLTLPYSNGPVEGFVTKVKLIKRMMYGRAGFALLRQRVLHAA